jgi:5'-nucleotidase
MRIFGPAARAYGNCSRPSHARGAEWRYIAANVRMKDTHEAALPETWFRELSDGRTVGFVGAVTEDLPSLVAGSGLAESVTRTVTVQVLKK